jgi:zinc protease
MKNLFILLAIIMATTMLSAKPGDGNKIFPFPYEKVTLPNGLKAILVPFDSPGLAAYYTVVRTGSRDEWEPGKSGFAHFFEHMMFRGTDTYPGHVYDSIVTSIGADANAYTSDDMTVFHLNIASADLERVMEIESDRFQNLKYTKEQFQTESGAVYGEYRKGRTNPWDVAIETMRDMAFDKHTYKHTTIGFERDVKDMPNQYEYSRSFYQRYYRPSNAVVVIVGDFDGAKVKSLLNKYYGSWGGAYVSPRIDPEPAQTAPRKQEVTYPGKTLPLVILGYKNDAFSTTNREYLATYHLAELAFGNTSELYKKLVLEEQKVQGIFTNPGPTRDPYMFEIYVEIKDEKDIDHVIGEIKSALAKFANTPVSTEKLEQLKKRNKYGFLMSLDTPDAIAGIMPQFITMTGDIDAIDAFYSGLDAVTPVDICNAVKKYFVPSNENLIILKGAKE